MKNVKLDVRRLDDFQKSYKKAILEYYSNPEADEWHERPHNEDLSYLSRYIHPEDKVLEIGCGQGKYTAELGSLCKDLIAVDPVKQNINHAADRIAMSGVKATLKVMDIDEVVDMPEQYDRIFFGMVLSQLPNPRYALEMTSKKLNNYGSIIVTESEMWPEPDGGFSPGHHSLVYRACNESGCKFDDVTREFGIPFIIDVDYWLKVLAADTSLQVKQVEYFGEKENHGRCFVSELAK